MTKSDRIALSFLMSRLPIEDSSTRLDDDAKRTIETALNELEYLKSTDAVKALIESGHLDSTTL